MKGLEDLMHYYKSAIELNLDLDCFQIIFVRKIISDTEHEFRAYIKGSEKYIGSGSDLESCKKSVLEYLQYYLENLEKFIINQKNLTAL